MGVAADLDRGELYVAQNGEWLTVATGIAEVIT